ncbi:MAG: NAD(P)/FAD-dependent oxidoreductase [Pseudomonadota bacterium]
MHRVETVVVGAGVVGLACARALAQVGREVVLLDAAEDIGTGISSRSSEVIHGGLYYPPGSLKATLCVEGKALLYRYCDAHGVGYRRCGKWLVASDDVEWAQLERIRENAVANGVTDLEPVSRETARALEPHLQCTGVLHSPSTGIVDSHGLMLAYLGDLEDAGGAFARHSRVTGAERVSDGFRLRIDGELESLHCRELINAAGLGAVTLARAIDGLPPDTVPTAHFAKGQYFRCSKRAPFSRLIYPVPQPGGLGIHLTLDLEGQARFGPDVHWVNAPEYSVDPATSGAFEDAIRRYWPGLPDNSLRPDYAGVRPKIAGPGESAADFQLSGETHHGVPGYLGLYGIESPGLTASLAIGARAVVALGV